MIWEEEDDGDDELLSEALDQAELQFGGGDAIDFQFIPYTDRRTLRFGVYRRVFTSRLS